MEIAWDKGYQSHEFFSQGAVAKSAGLEFLANNYSFRQHPQRPDLYLNESSTGIVAIAARPKDFSVTLFDRDAYFIPNPAVLDYRIIAHFLKAAKIGRLVLADGQPIDDGVYSALLSCYVNGDCHGQGDR